MKKQIKTYRSVMPLVLMLMPGLIAAGNPKKDDLQNQVDKLDQRVTALETVEVCPPGAPMRFVDNGDGTICDHLYGLMWEKKDAADDVEDLLNPHDVDNRYSWSSTGLARDGTAFTVFLASLNGDATRDPDMAGIGFAGYRDWRLPNSIELQTLLFEPFPCSLLPCIIDPIFTPTAAKIEAAEVLYLSSTFFGLPGGVWGVGFGSGSIVTISQSGFSHARAVRGSMSDR